MAVRLHFQSTGTVPGNARPVTMAGRSLTVGRGQDNDLVLPDPGKVVSKHHVVIEDQNGNLVAIDLSTNGTFLNYGKVPLGRVPTPINDGDILSLGGYELMVEVTDEAVREAVPPPPDDAPSPAGGAHPADLLEGPDDHADFLDELLGDARPAGPASVRRPEPGDDGLLPPLGEDDLLAPPPEEPVAASASWHEHGASPSDSFRAPEASDFIPEDWAADLMGSAPPRPPAEPDPEHEPGREPADIFALTEETSPPARVSIPPVSSVPEPPAATAGDAAARAFLAALGAPDMPEAEVADAMARLGLVMRTLILGLREILMTRAAIKSEFRIQQTVIGRSGNNPLKFSVTPEQAVEALVRPRGTGYLDPVRATEQALDDIKAHEVAVMTGMEAALKGILQQLAPEALAEQIQARAGFADMLRSRKALYWEAYEQHYGRISDQAEKEFRELFSREFARAYQAQMERLK